MVKNGLMAGLVATIVLSAIMIGKAMAGMLPEFNVIKDWSTVLGNFGLPAGPVSAWLAHLFVGIVVWGLLFGAVKHKLHSSTGIAGIVFGVLAWVAMMVIFMPLAGNGFFGLGIGVIVPMMSLILHLIYGAALGVGYYQMAEGD